MQTYPEHWRSSSTRRVRVGKEIILHPVNFPPCVTASDTRAHSSFPRSKFGPHQVQFHEEIMHPLKLTFMWWVDDIKFSSKCTSERWNRGVQFPVENYPLAVKCCERSNEFPVGNSIGLKSCPKIDRKNCPRVKLKRIQTSQVRVFVQVKLTFQTGPFAACFANYQICSLS